MVNDDYCNLLIVFIIDVCNVKFKLTLSMLRQSLNEKQIVLTLRRRKIQETTNALVQ
jgi:hypothetical protein